MRIDNQNIQECSEIEISVVIPAKNEGECLSDCLDAIFRAQGDKKHLYEVIVVDNNSEDNTLEIAKKYNCRVVKNTQNGPASTRNVGASIAKGKYIAFIDADCILSEEWFDLTKEHLSDPDVVAVGTKISPDFKNATWVEKSVFNLINRRGVTVSDNIVKVTWIGTSNMLIRKESFERIGGFDQKLTTCEDYDLCQRIACFGDILIDKRITTMHLRESKNLRELFRRELWRGQDSLHHWSREGYGLYEAPSIIIPFLFITSFFLFVFFSMTGHGIGGVFFIIAMACALLKVIRSKRAFSDPLTFFQCLTVSAVYYLARGVALVKESVKKIGGSVSK